MNARHADIDQLLEDAESAKNRPAKRRWLRNSLIVLGSLVALLGIGVGVVYFMLQNSFNEVQRVSIEQDPTLKRPEVPVVEDGQNTPINVLLLGSDSRDVGGLAAEELGGFRSDAIMVAQISPDRQNVTIMSIMRDNWVEIQGHGEAKINAAVSFGGLPLAVNTVENFIDARIDRVAVIDFESFKGLTDAVGGVTVHNTIAYTAQNGGGGYFFEEGDIHMDGAMALSFVRERYAFSDGDYQRARNQQAYMKGLMSKLLSRDTLTSPEKIIESFEALKPYLVLDSGFDLNTAIGLGLDLRYVRGGDISFFTSPTLGTGTSVDGQSIVLPDWESLEEVRAAFREGTVHEYAAAQ